ncbi:class I SAM-dependent methyltransferase [Amycolatopsis anabasis]|uniref:class I SAM-dependent methyltransferase n=1 Tax=Amycolatopsis anabasis TaxID=1840409 RepID=UPI00131CD49B|nr:class I SAM-dependent methyltransferase [Amycolatopsis anabasis]
MPESQQYDAISELYERVKHIPVGLAEQETVFSALPGLRGRSVLDVGCGTGFYPRKFREAGARRVIGVDSSREMISHAQGIEEHDPLGVSYEVHDAASLPKIGDFDVVTAIWLLGYAEGEDGLDRMVTGLAANLAAGGTLVALVPNPDLDWDHFAAYQPYGLWGTKTVTSSGRQGCVVHVAGDPPFDFESYFWPPGVIEASLDRAGFTGVRRHPPEVPPKAMADRGEAFWAPLLANPTFAVLTATR